MTFKDQAESSVDDELRDQEKIRAHKARIDEVFSRLFSLIENKEADAETRIWARQEISQLIKIMCNPPVTINWDWVTKPYQSSK